MNVKYLIRLDDACPKMDREKWQRMEDLLDCYGIKPLVGIIPANDDPDTMIDEFDSEFWHKAHLWETKGWQIALHGYSHVCDSNDGMKGLNPMWQRSEFSGISLNEQRRRIRQGYAILKEHGFTPRYFFAPSHTFDENTLEALRLETGICFICDTIGRYPYRKDGFCFIPQISGHAAKMYRESILSVSIPISWTMEPLLGWRCFFSGTLGLLLVLQILILGMFPVRHLLTNCFRGCFLHKGKSGDCIEI